MNRVDFENSISIINELSNYDKEKKYIEKKFELLHNFVRKIVIDWKCDPNHA